MKNVAFVFILSAFFFSQPAATQQWEPLLLPPQPQQSLGFLMIEDDMFNFTNVGIFRRHNDDNTWELIRDYMSSNPLQVFKVDRNNNRIYWSEGLDTAGYFKLFRSSDLGSTWQLIGNVKAWVSAFIGDTIYGGCHVGLGLCAKSGSENWKVMPSYPYDSAGYIWGVAADGKHLWAITENGIYHSPDAGYHWEQSLPLSDVEETIFGSISIEALNGEVVVTDEEKKRIYFTKDTGATWQEAPWYRRKLFNSGQHLFAIDDTGAQLWRFAGNDPANWENLMIGAINDVSLTGVGEHEGSIWLDSWKLGVFVKKPGDNKWRSENGAPINRGGVLRFQDGNLFLDNYAQTFSSDNGVTWQQNLYELFPNLWSNGNYNYLNKITTLYRCPRNGRFEWEIFSDPPEDVKNVIALGDTLLAYTYNNPPKLIQSFDNGASWSNMITLPADFYQTAIKVLHGKLYVIKNKTLHRSDDLGATWQPAYTFPYTADESVGRLLIVKDTMFLSYPPLDLIFYSSDGGQSFDTLPAPQNFNAATFNLRSLKDLLLLDMAQQVFYSSKDAGKTWSTLTRPTGISQPTLASIIDRDYWTYDGSTLYLPGESTWRLRFDAQRQVSGKVFLDSNGNGLRDAGEQGVNNLIVQAIQSGVLSTTYNNGDFSMLLGQQDDELSVATTPKHYVVAPTSVAVPDGASSIPSVSFALQPQGSVNDASVDLAAANNFRAGYDNTLHVKVKNVGTVALNGQLKLGLGTLLNVSSQTPAANVISGDTLIWDYINLQPLQEQKFQVVVKTAVVPPGEPIFIQAETSNGIDVDMSDNVAILEEQVVSSYDPNDKKVSETHVPVNETEGEELVYTVRFQNLGNIETDFITIRDTLSVLIDAGSVRVLTASHPYEWQIEDGRVLVFHFNPVRLAPASEDSLRSQGFVQFAAKLKSGLQIGNEIANTAYIYFDFNPAVVTNTVSTYVTVVATFEPARWVPSLKIFPNPTNNRTILRLPEGVSGTGQIEIFSAEGKLVYSVATQENLQEVELTGARAGTYWCRWKAAGKFYWGKLVVVQ